MYTDDGLRAEHARLLASGGVEKVSIGRGEATKNRMRVVSDRGKDVIIDVPRGLTIRDGDVLAGDGDWMLVVEWLPEDALILTVDRSADWKEQVERAVRLGYVLGMKHFHPFIAGNEVVVPVEGDRESMLKAFATMKELSCRVEKRVLREAQEAQVEHGH